MDLFPPFHSRRHIIFSIGAIPHKIPSWKDIIDRIRDGFLPAFVLTQDVIRSIAGVGVEYSSIDLELSLRLEDLLLLDYLLDVVSSVSGRVIKFSLGKYFVLRDDGFFSSALKAFVIIVQGIVGVSVKFSSNFYLLSLPHQFRRRELFVILQVVALVSRAIVLEVSLR